jgi:hypothetical protein
MTFLTAYITPLDGLERVWEEVVVPRFERLSKHSNGGAEENHGIPSHSSTSVGFMPVIFHLRKQ